MIEILALTEGAVQPGVQRCDRHAEARGRSAVDHHIRLEAALLTIRRNVRKFGNFFHPLDNFRIPFVEFGDGNIRQSILIKPLADAPTSAQILRRLHRYGQSGDACEFRTQPVNDLDARGFALARRFQSDEQPSLIRRRRQIAGSDEGADVVDVRLLGEHLHRLFLQSHHLVEGDVGRRLGCAVEEADVVLRQISLGDVYIEMHGEIHGAQNDGEHDPRVVDD